MKNSIINISLVLMMVGLVSGCANTIRGIGQDGANTVHATKNAGNNVGRAVSR